MSGVWRVLVQGAGIGGLTLAAALARRGVEVDVAERRAEAPHGIGLNVPANALGALAEIGVRGEVIAAGWPFEDLLVQDAAGKPLACIPPPPSAYGRPSNVALGRPAYARILRGAAETAGARVIDGVTVAEISQDPDGVDVRLGCAFRATTACQAARYDLVVGFDGVRSALRRQVSAATPVFVGSAVWRATAPRHPAVDGIVLSMSPDAKAVLTPISAESMYVAVVTAEPGNPRHDPATFLPLLRRRLAPFGGVVAELRDGLDATSRISYAPLEEVTVHEPWYRGRVVIAGDAAHASTPHLAQGGAMAVEDAVVLADALTCGLPLPEALASWDARRRPRAMFVQDMSRALLRHELGEPTTPDDDKLIALGIPGAQQRLAEQY